MPGKVKLSTTLKVPLLVNLPLRAKALVTLLLIVPLLVVVAVPETAALKDAVVPEPTVNCVFKPEIPKPLATFNCEPLV